MLIQPLKPVFSDVEVAALLTLKVEKHV